MPNAAEWYMLSAEEVMKKLLTQAEGLSAAEAAERLRKYGLNELKVKKKISPVRIFISQFTSVLIVILLLAGMISFLIGNVIDAAVILAIVLLNGIFGFVQDYNAEKAIEALKRMAPLKATVMRNGKETVIEAREIVPGDIILLESGTKIPADLRIIESAELEADESILTGESVPVKKNPNVIEKSMSAMHKANMLFTGTIVTRGRATAMAVCTGINTEIGKMAVTIHETAEARTPLQLKLDALGKALGFIAICACIFIFFIGIILMKLGLLDMFIYSVSLAVAAVPEGMPAVVTLSLAIGVQKMARKKALVRKLPAVEALGSVDVICADKTGTITENRMTVRKLCFNGKTISVTGEGYGTKGDFLAGNKKLNPKELWPLLRIGLMCNDAKLRGDDIIGDPTEAALIVSAEKAGLKASGKRMHEIPFDSFRKRMTIIDENGTAFCKGAPHVVLELCDRIYENGTVKKLTKKRRQEILGIDNKLAGEAMRVLAFAYREGSSKGNAEKNLIFAGMQAMIDPPRKEVRQAISQCRTAGIRVVMLTGDNKYTAKAIAEEIGIDAGTVITGDDISEKSLYEIVETANVFARVTHEDKMKIMETLKHNGHIVAMTGDGVNDATALKKADIGVAMGVRGTDVAKEASDIVLMDDNFATIVSAIKEGRTVYDNIKRFVFYLLSANTGEVLLVFLAFILGMPLPLLAIQLLWINLVTDGLPALSIGIDPSPKGIMERKPRDPKERILNRRVLKHILLLGTMLAFAVLAVFLSEINDLAKAQTMVFTSFVVLELIKLQHIRSIDGLKITDNKYILLAIASSLLLQLAVIYTPLAVFFRTVPLAIGDWLIIAAITAAYYFAIKAVSRMFK